MTDQTTTADTTTDTTTQSSTTTTSDAAAGGAAAEPKFWESFQDEALKTSPNITRYNSVEDMARGLEHANKRLGVPAERLLKIPEKPDDAEGWAAVHKALGRPDDVAGYGVELPAELPDETKPVIEGLLSNLHKAGATTPVVKAVIEAINTATAASDEARAKAREAETAAVTNQLKEDWGEKYEVYKKGIGTLLNNEKLGGGQALIDELNGLGLGNSVGLNKLLANVTDLLAEDGKLPGGGGDQTGAMTPAAAKAARIALEADPVKGKALRDKSDPLHASVLEERNRLFAFESPSQKTG